MLPKLEILPMVVGMDLRSAYEDGVIYSREVLDIPDDYYSTMFATAAHNALALGVSIAFPTKETIVPLIAKAFRETMNLSVEAAIPTKENIDILLAKADAQMLPQADTPATRSRRGSAPPPLQPPLQPPPPRPPLLRRPSKRKKKRSARKKQPLALVHYSAKLKELNQMEYIYSAMVLYSAGKDITEDAINAILTAAGVEADAAKIKALVASLEGHQGGHRKRRYLCRACCRRSPRSRRRCRRRPCRSRRRARRGSCQ